MLIIAFIVCSCEQQSKTQTEKGAILLSPIKEINNIIDIAPYVEDVNIITIKDTIGNLVGDVSKMLIDNNDNIFIIGHTTPITVLKKDGTPQRQIARRGRGPKEYTRINDIALSEDKEELLILDDDRIRCYKITDSLFYREIQPKIKLPFDAIAPATEGGVFIFNTYPLNLKDLQKANPMLYLVDRDGNVKGEYIDREDISFTIANITQGKNGYLLRPQNNNNVVWRMIDNSIVPAFEIDFGIQNIPKNYYFDQAGEDLGKYMSAPYFKLPIYFHESGKFLYFKATDATTEHNYLYDLDTKSGIRWADIPSDRSTIMMMGADENYFYYIVQPTALLDYNPDSEHSAMQKFIVNNIKEAIPQYKRIENPLIVKIRFKL